MISGTSYTGFSSSCIQLGKNGGVENITFSTSAIPGTIKSVSVECASYSGAHNVSISVGGNEYLASTSTSSWTTVNAKTGTGTSSGEITISFTDGTRALYIKSISVTYDDGQALSYTSYDVLFDSNGGSEVADAASSENTGKVTKPSNPTWLDHKFLGWFIDEDDDAAKDDDEDYWDFDKEVTEDLILTADWQELPSNSITFSDYYNDSDNLSFLKTTEFSIEFEKNSGTQPVYYPSDFTGRVYVSNSFVISSLVANKAISSIVFEFGKETGSFSCDNGSYSASTWTGTAENVEFTVSTKAFIKSISITTISAKSVYSVLFDYNGDDANTDDVELSSNKYTGLVEKPADPVRDGYNFDGWFQDEDLDGIKDDGESFWNFSDEVDNDLFLCAKYTKIATFQTDVNVISSWASLSYDYSYSGYASHTVNLIPTVNETEYNGSVTVTKIDTLDLSTEFGSDAEGIFEILWNKNNSSNFYFKDNDTRIYRNGGEYVVSTLDNSYMIGKVKINGTNAESLTIEKNNNSVSIKNNTSDKNVTITSMEITYYKINITKCNFRLRIGIDSSIFDIDDIDDFGVKIVTSSKEKEYMFSEYTFYEDNTDEIYYIVINLGNVLTNKERITDEFTICAFVVGDAKTYYSTNKRTISIKSLLETYHENDSTKDLVQDLYDLVVAFGL